MRPELYIDLNHPANKPVLNYFLKDGTSVDVVDKSAISSKKTYDPYYECGCHPDIVIHIWDNLDPRIPAKGACVINNVPAILHNKTGIVLAIAMGAMYCVKVMKNFHYSAAAEGYSSTHIRNGITTDLKRKLGEEWLFGSFSKSEIEWCQATYEFYRNKS